MARMRLVPRFGHGPVLLAIASILLGGIESFADG